MVRRRRGARTVALVSSAGTSLAGDTRHDQAAQHAAGRGGIARPPSRGTLLPAQPTVPSSQFPGSSMAKYRTAVIACGTIARVHARGWQHVPGQPTEIAAIADTHPDALREFGDFFGVPNESRYTDYREMLDAEHPDFVDVCSWHRLHAEMTIAAATRGTQAIICQKPMALSLGQADEMVI